MPHFIGVFRHVDAAGFIFSFGVVQAKFNPRGVGGKQREIDALAIPGRAAGKGRTVLNSIEKI
jgi:hypothetical protein